MARGPLRHITAAGEAFRKLIVWLSADEVDIAASPTITSGAGAPTASEPAGSLYVRTNGALYTASDAVGTWAAAAAGADFGATGLLTDVVAESTAAAGVTVDGLRIKDAQLAPIAGGTAYATLASCASGEGDLIVAANLADATSWRTAALTYLQLATTTATPSVAWTFVDTAAVSAHSVTGSINHATAAYAALEAHATQLTTARTSGRAVAVKGGCTSLAGDTAGVIYADFEAIAPTDGGAAAHVAYWVAAGHDVALDLSECATGEGDVVLADNLASALQIREATNAIWTVVTTTGAKSIDSSYRITTTDGVASGTAKVVGGRLTSSVADSTTINQAASGYSAFDVTASIPANTLKAGSRLKVRAVVRISTILNGGATVEGAKLLLESTVLLVVHGSTAGAADTRCLVEGEFVARAAPGGAVALAGVASGAWSDTVAKVTVGAPAGGVPTFATNGALVFSVQVSTSAAGDTTGRLVLEDLYTEVI